MTEAINPLIEKGKEEKRLPHSFIAYLCDHLKEYQLDEGNVGMPIKYTPAVIGMILYFMKKEPKTSKTKLEWQMHLLDNINLFGVTEGHILDWSKDKKNGRPNLEKFLLHMEKKGLIAKKGKMYVLLKEDFVKKHLVPDAFFQKGYFLRWLNRITDKLLSSTATETGKLVKEWIEKQFIQE